MKVVTPESLAQAGYPAELFNAIALAGGFGDIKPSPDRALDIAGIVDEDAKKAVAALLNKKEGKTNAPTNAG